MPAPRTCNCMSCDKCRHREERRRVYRLQAYGAWNPWGDLDAVLEHLAYLRTHRVGTKRISELTGLSTSTLSRIRSGRNKQITKTVANAILSIQPEHTLRVEPIGVSRRIRALMALGWSTYYIAERLGKTQGNIWELSKGRHWVNAETFEMVEALYRELSMKQGPSNITRIRALRAGHVPPLGWDDHEIDDPDAQPRGVGFSRKGLDDYDESVVLRILAGEWKLKATAAERREVVRRWDRPDPMGGAKANDPTAPSLAYLERLTGWRVDRYKDEEMAS